MSSGISNRGRSPCNPDRVESPRFETYGDFYTSDLFGQLFPDYGALQRTAADSIVQPCMELLESRSGEPSVDTIVDLGCGDGVLGLEVRNLIQSRLGRPIAYFGIDRCPGMVQLATSNLGKFNAGSQSRILQTEEGIESEALSHVEWSKTVLVCLSHTWFHFLDQSALLAVIAKKRPTILVIDEHHGWYPALDQLLSQRRSANGDSHPALRLGTDTISLSPSILDAAERVIGTDSYTLRTQLVFSVDASQREVVRGIHGRRHDASFEEWVFATRQVASVARPCSQSELDGRLIPFSLGVIRDSLESNGRFRRADQFHHQSALGEMRTLVVCRR